MSVGHGGFLGWRLLGGIARRSFVGVAPRRHDGCLGELLVKPGEHGEDALVAYKKDFLDAETANKLFEFCRDRVEWAREFDDFGPQERESCYVGDPGCALRSFTSRRVCFQREGNEQSIELYKGGSATW